MTEVAKDRFDLLALARRYGPARPLSSREAWYIDSALRAKKSMSGPSAEIVGNWLVREAKRFKGWRSPYSFFRRTNVRGLWTLAAYHHRAQLCWEWSLSFAIGKATRARSWNPLKWFYHYGGQAALGIPMLFEFRLHRQPYGWMLSSDAENMLKFLCELEKMQREAA